MRLNLDKQTGLKLQVNLPEGTVQTPEIRLVIRDKNNPKGLSVVVPAMNVSDDGTAQIVVPPLEDLFTVDQECEAIVEVITGTQYFTGGSMLVEMVITKPAAPKVIPVELFEEEDPGDFEWLLKEDAPEQTPNPASDLAAAKAAWEAQKKAILAEEKAPEPKKPLTKEELAREKLKREIKNLLLGKTSPPGKTTASKTPSRRTRSTNP